MKKYFYILLIAPIFTMAQVGINTTTPAAQLEIKSSNQATPANTDGILIPKVDAFPVVNPTVAQQGMLVYLTTSSGSNPIGFYYWNFPTLTWLPLKGTDGGTLDQAYDFGGAGVGRTITADTGAVLINGTDGLVSTGTIGSGVVAPNGPGTRIVWNPRKAAFRLGTVTSAQWDDANVGSHSTALGFNTTASGQFSIASGQNSTASGNNAIAHGFQTVASGQYATAFGGGSTASGEHATALGFSQATGIRSTALGYGTTASNDNSTALGSFTIASGVKSTAFGNFSNALGNSSTAFGFVTSASGNISTAFGSQNTAASYGETVLGIGATTYTPSTNGATQFGSANATDRLFVIGNAIDSNNNDFLEVAERSDALIILKNGLTRLPSTTNAMITASDGKAIVTKEYLQSNTSGTLDQAYDFGGAGVGRTITADTGAVTIHGTDGLVSTGNIGIGALAPSGPGVKMFWNPRKAAFRAGSVVATIWDDHNVGQYSVAFGESTSAAGSMSAAFGSTTIASGNMSSAFGNGSRALGQVSTAFGMSAYATGDLSTAFGNASLASGPESTAFGSETIASGYAATAFGWLNNVTGTTATAFGFLNTASGDFSTAFGLSNTSRSYGETVLGLGATNYTISTNGTTQFRTANATDRLFVVGNAIDANNNNFIDAAERSDAMVVLKNGNIGFGSSNPDERLVVSGNIRNTVLAGVGNRLVASNSNGNLVPMAAGTNGQVLTQTAGGPIFQTPASPGGTLDQAYDFGGAGLGRTITADTGAVTIAGTDGFISTGTISNGAIVPSGSGVRMVWNPRKAAFRAGSPFSTEWDDANVGISSAAFGFANTASGAQSTAFGSTNFATGNSSTAFGGGVIASGLVSTAFGSGTNASGRNSTAFGFHSIASGDYATAYGNENAAFSFGETTLGIGATTYLPSTNGATQFRAANAVDRLFVIGNAIDLNNNDSVDAIEKRDALVILKNGLTRLPSTTNAMITAADGKAVVTKEYLQSNTSGTLDQSYDFGGAGVGRTITADTGAVTINGTDGLVSTGAVGGGALAPSGPGVKMFWNPRRAAFRAGEVQAGQWDSPNIGTSSSALGRNVTASGSYSAAIGSDNNATGESAMAFGNDSTASGDFSTAIGNNNNATGASAMAFGIGSIASGLRSVALGATNTASGDYSFAGGRFSIAIGNHATTFGLANTAPSFGETVLGIGATIFIPTINGATQFGAANATDRLLVVGNAIDADNDGNVINPERRNALVILKNGDTCIGNSIPQTKLEIIDTNKITSSFTEGNLHVSSNNSQNTDIGASISLGGFGSLVTSTTVFATIEGRKSNAGPASDSGYLSLKTNNVGTLAERMRITNQGDVGIGTPAPGGQFELSLNEGRKPTSNTWTIPSDARLKNVNGMYEKGLAEIIQLQPIRYNYKNTDKKNFDQRVLDKEAFGFLAQEVQPLFPEAVGVDPDGYFNFDLHPILIASINALKELNEKNTQLESENEQLKVAMKQMEQKIAVILIEVENLKR